MSKKIAVVGTGLVGRSWSIVFARSGFEVCLYDPIDGAVDNALSLIEESLPDLFEANLLNGNNPDVVRARIQTADSLPKVLDGAFYMQESAPERIEVKQALYQQLDQFADPETILASSTSGIAASRFTEHLDNRQRCLVAHPINPPHIVPLVEIVPALWTETSVVEKTRALMEQVRQAPIQLNHEVKGFVANRLQGALLAEAFRLVEDGVCSVADVDTSISAGLGLRWSFMGPFETIDLNAANGIRGYCDMVGQLYYELAHEQADPREWTEPLIAEIERQRREVLAEAITNITF
ncbi:MAG: 3-hydroxyacyl-CoA dehydrogenase, partial [Chloroflexota bacterium]